MKMTELTAELLAAPIGDWMRVPFTENHHKWLLLLHRLEDGGFCFVFVSPTRRTYSFWTERVADTDTERVACAEVTAASSGVTVASYYGGLGDKPSRMDDVLRLTPKHIIDRLSMMLDAIG